MANVDNCIFCKIATHEMDSRVVMENDLVLAFDDITPQAPVHVLIIPKDHYVSLGDDVPEEVLAALFRMVPEVAKAKGVDESGYRVIINTGRHASQTVQHLHVHLLAGAQMSHGMVLFA